MGALILAGPGPVGYNNLINWPSVANRPVLSGTTLSWIGPVGGGPSTAADTAQTQALTASGSVASSANNQVIENLNITGNTFDGNVKVTHSNVTVRKCRILGHALGIGFGSVVNWSGTGGVIEDCIIDGNNTASPVDNAQNGFQPGGVGPTTIRRCTYARLENHITSGVNMTIIDNWFHLSTGADQDMVEMNAGATGNTIQHNSFDGSDKIGGFLNAGINLTNFGGTGNITAAVTNNAFISLENFGVCDDDTQGIGSVTWSAENNGFFSNGGGLRRDATVVSPNTGNFLMANATAISGALINGGTGAI